MMYLSIFFVFIVNQFTQCNLELQPFITGGDFVEYNKYPHSVFLIKFCGRKSICSGSILNQKLVLTAAHCLDECLEASDSSVQVKYGHEDIKNMKYTLMDKCMLHQNYVQGILDNDIALITTEEKIPLNEEVKRVILMESPPVANYAYVAGWGLDENEKRQRMLKHTRVMMQSPDVCDRTVKLREGTFCAGPLEGLGSAYRGDSGGALIINDCIQIGIVSYKVDQYSVTAYTNVSYFLDWIKEGAKELFQCRNKTD